jgi:peptidyl-prolyl cis-trans isomerase SurA
MKPTTRLKFVRGIARAAGVVLCLATANVLLPAQAPAQPSSTVVLDKVVALVNRHVILSSDIDEEIRLSILDPARAGQGTLTPDRALEQLISRSLIDQQIRREDFEAAAPTQEEVNARLTEIRKELPACVRENCASDSGWKAFLEAHDLTPERVESYLRYRLEILSFIEDRFRPGIHISPQDIETYYRQTLLPEYGPGEAIPSLERVSPRIEEILLQQQVNALFDEWLTSMRKQGDVEVLDPALESPENPATAPATDDDTQPDPNTDSPPVNGKGGSR